MKYTEKEIAQLRQALVTFRENEGQPMNWVSVREAIAARTGYEIGASPKSGAERLRQFVEGIKSSSGGRRYHALKDDDLDAIAKLAGD